MIKTKKAPKPCYMLQRFLGKLNEYLLQDKRLEGRRSTFFGLIPLISGSKVCYMANGGFSTLSKVDGSRQSFQGSRRSKTKRLCMKTPFTPQGPWASLIEQKTEFKLTMWN